MPEDRISTRFDFWFLIYKCFKVLIGTCFGNLVAIGSQLNKTRKKRQRFAGSWTSSLSEKSPRCANN